MKKLSQFSAKLPIRFDCNVQTMRAQEEEEADEDALFL